MESVGKRRERDDAFGGRKIKEIKWVACNRENQACNLSIHVEDTCGIRTCVCVCEIRSGAFVIYDRVRETRETKTREGERDWEQENSLVASGKSLGEKEG